MHTMITLQSNHTQRYPEHEMRVDDLQCFSAECDVFVFVWLQMHAEGYESEVQAERGSTDGTERGSLQAGSRDRKSVV